MRSSSKSRILQACSELHLSRRLSDRPSVPARRSAPGPAFCTARRLRSAAWRISRACCARSFFAPRPPFGQKPFRPCRSSLSPPRALDWRSPVERLRQGEVCLESSQTAGSLSDRPSVPARRSAPGLRAQRAEPPMGWWPKGGEAIRGLPATRRLEASPIVLRSRPVAPLRAHARKLNIKF